ncbi:MAG: extracellular solute-binding protein [Oscillospiraceae bacterium]|nr:extracellular solute-binding protein [Oscillospiraceae bacterium]
MKRIISGIVVVAMTASIALTFSSCGKKGDVLASKEHVYSTEKITLPEGLDYIDKVLYSNDKLYFLGNHYWTEKVKIDDLPAEEEVHVSGDVAFAVTNAVFAAAPDEVQSVSDDADASDDTSGDTSATDTDAAGTEAEPAETAVPSTDPEIPDDGYTEIGHNETMLQIVSLDGTLEKEIVLAGDDDDRINGGRNIRSISIDKDGGLITIHNKYSYDQETGESSNEYFLVKYSDDGTVMSDVSLAALEPEDVEYFYLSNVVSVGGSQYLVMSDNTLFLIDVSGKILKKLVNEKVDNNTWMSGIYEAGDGRYFTTTSRSYEENGEWKSERNLVEIDIENQQFGKEYPYDIGGSFMNGTEKYDLLATRDSGLIGYDIETGNSEIIIDWIKSGIDTSTLQTETTTVLPDGRILCMTYDYTYYGGGSYGWGGDNMVLSILTEIPPEELPDKKLIKLYSLYLDMDVKRRILDFNQNSLEYEVELTSYNDYGYSEGTTKMNNDMVAGNLPDIIILNSELPIDSYISKGLFANIYDFIDNDPDISRSDFLENIFKAYEVDGKLYEIVPYFNISTLIGKSSLLGDTPGWTMDEFVSFVDSNPDKLTFPDYNTKDNILQTFIYYNYSSYIDKETGECFFESDNFIKLLEFCNRFPTSIPDDYWENHQGYWEEEENDLRSGKRLFELYNLYNFTSLREMEHGKYGEPITYKGIPGASGGGSAIIAGTSMAITSKANNSEGAWEFIKYFYSDEYQDQYSSGNSYGFPVKLSSIEKKAEAAKERPYWEDENGEKQYYDNEYWIGNKSFKIGVNTDEDNQKVMDFIKSVTNIFRYDTNITKIISEESGSYFEGQKSAAEVAKIIQNRVSNYIAESR